MIQILIINFKGEQGEHQIKVKHQMSVPAIGHSIHNEKDGTHYYIVDKIDWFFYNDEYTHIIINATQKNYQP
jgi:hypothetical protein